MVPVTQYRVRVSRRNRREAEVRPFGVVLLHAVIFSPTQAASPIGESSRAAARLAGLVEC